MKDKLTDFMRVGKVSAVFPKKGTAEVVFEDRENSVSRELFILVPYTLKNKAYYMPEVQERVVCCFDPGAQSVGYILGSFYSDARLPPFGDSNKTYIKFEDDTLIEYDKNLHKLTIDIQASGDTSVEIKASGDITIESEKDLTLKGKSNTLVL